MKLAHISDVHLGYRQGCRATSTGINQREADVAAAFRAAVDGILTAKPDIVCICGDLFNTVRPSNTAINFAFKQLRRMRDAGLPVVLIAGNHDCPKTAESGSILRLFSELGVDVATNEVRQFYYPTLDLNVTAVPDRAELERSPFCPRGKLALPAKYRVLCIHGLVEGACPPAEATVPLSLALSEAWSYVALGDYHIRHQVGPRAWYSGSLEFTSTNIWAEAGTPKGWLLADLDAGTVEPQLVPTRQVLDLDPIDATDLIPAGIDALLAERLADISGKLVRLRVLNVPRSIARQLDHKAIRRYQADALLVQLELLRPESVARERLGRPRQSLAELVADFLGRRELPAGMDRELFARVGRQLLEEVAQDEIESAKEGAA